MVYMILTCNTAYIAYCNKKADKKPIAIKKKADKKYYTGSLLLGWVVQCKFMGIERKIHREAIWSRYGG